VPSIEEYLSSPSDPFPIHDALTAGVDVLGQHETVKFYPYIRKVLPYDGFIFWLNARLLSNKQLAEVGLPSDEPVEVLGSLHYAMQSVQAVDETIVVRKVDFTATEEVDAFAQITPRVMYVATWETGLGAFRFTFSTRNAYYVQAGLHHYVGDAIYPVFEAQLIDDISQFDERTVVSNSMPIWLAMMAGVPFSPAINPPPGIEMFPAYLVPDNLVPPYIAVDIPPSSTRAVQASPRLLRTGSRVQLCTERVTLTTYGLRNDEAADLLDYIFSYSEVTNLIGVLNMPVLRDERRIQLELTALAQKKSVEIEISYNQQRLRDIVRQMIDAATFTVIPNERPVV
jgi:hypothetical protein